MSGVMEITPEQAHAHREMSRYNLEFLQFVQNKPPLLRRSGYPELDNRDPKRVLQPFPTFISTAKRTELEETSTGIYRLVKSLPRRFFNLDIDEISNFYNIPRPDVEAALYGVDDFHVDSLLSRGDFVWTTSGLKCVEFNVGTHLGGAQVPVWENKYLNTAVIAQFITQSGARIRNANLLEIFLEHIISAVRKKMPHNVREELNVVVGFPQHGEWTANSAKEHAYVAQLYSMLLAKKYHPLKGELAFCDFSLLRQEDSRVFLGDRPIHFILEFSHGKPPIMFRTAQDAGNLFVLNGDVSDIVSNKLNLALMSENQESKIFSPGERELIKKHIPWSRRVSPGETVFHGRTVRMEDLLLRHRSQLVLKPSDGLGGRDVLLGNKTTEDKWRAGVNRALDEKDWLVQEMVESIPLLYQSGPGRDGVCQHNLIWGTFVFGNRYGGTWIRLQPKEHPDGIINFAQGAEASVLFEVDE